VVVAAADAAIGLAAGVLRGRQVFALSFAHRTHSHTAHTRTPTHAHTCPPPLICHAAHVGAFHNTLAVGGACLQRASHNQARSVWVHCWLLASTAGAGRASSRSKLPLHVVSSAHPTVVSGRDGSVSPAASPPPSPKGAGGMGVDPVALARQAFAGVCFAKWVYAYASVGVCP
jgi:hypothetical protein